MKIEKYIDDYDKEEFDPGYGKTPITLKGVSDPKGDILLPEASMTKHFRSIENLRRFLRMLEGVEQK